MKDEYYQQLLNIIEKDEALSKEFTTFCYYLLDTGGYKDFPLELKSRMVLDLSLRLKNYLILNLLNNLPPDAFKELDEITDKLEQNIINESNLNEIYKEFWIKYLPNYEEIIKKSIEEFARIFLQKEQ
ncbi:MAG: hypothetical protein KatS3mg095_0388 [Candidatus Parcubacteria bacterium]|nr:MAG: hypothetical protein KatS3mg095_0388 [Candidatus Parcubacteria bacterium]